MNEAIPEGEKGRRLVGVEEKQREIQGGGNAELAGQTFEVLVSGKSRRENRWTGYTTSHRMINFASQERKLLGTYVQVRVTGAGPNSLGGEHAVELREASMEVEMKIRGLMMAPVTNMPIVGLKDVQGQAILPIWVGVYEANAIALEIEKVQTPRPITHHLLKNVFLGLEVRLQKIVG